MDNKWEIKVHKEDPNNKRADYSNYREVMYCPLCGAINTVTESAQVRYMGPKNFMGHAHASLRCSCGLSYQHGFDVMADTLEIAQEQIEKFFEESNERWETRYKVGE